MGFLKKITRPISKVLDKIVPNEIKPALPFLSAALPFFGPAQGLMGTGVRRLLMGGGANLLAQLSQEGNEGEVNPLSLGLATLTAGMTDPGAAQYLQGLKSPTGDFAPARTGLQKFKDQALDLGITGVEKLQNLQEAVGAKGILSKEGAQLASIPFTQGSMDLAMADARRTAKDLANEALASLPEGASDADRALAIRQFMEAAGYFSEDEIVDTITAAGYADGGRVGLRMGGSSDPDFSGIKGAVISVDENMRADRAGDFFRLRDEAIQKGDDDKIKEIESDFFKEFGMVMPKTAKDGGIMNAKRGLVDEPGGYAGEMPSIKEIWSKEGENDPLGTIVKLGLTFRKPIVEIVNAIGVTASVAADLISGVAKLGYDVTEPIRDVVGDVAGGIYDIGKEMVKGSKDNTRFIQPLYYLQRFGGDKNLTDDETRLLMQKQSVGRKDDELVRELENRVFGFDDAGINQRPEDKEVSETIKFKEKYNFADGGLMSLGGKEMDLRGGGFVPIGKKERADDVPARLSKNEFVMTADAVRGAGGGDINKGAKRMYETMNRLEARA